MGRQPLGHRDGRLILTPVLVVRVDVVPPRLNSAGHSFPRPESNFRLRSRRKAERRAGGLIERETLRHQLVPAEHAVDELAGLTVRLKARRVGPALAVEHDELGAPANLAIVAKL